MRYSRHEFLNIPVSLVRHAPKFASIEVCGVTVGGILDKDIRALMHLLLSPNSNPEATKDQICDEIWGLAYNPSIHDGKIYKLIHKARAFFGKPELFLNVYGSYRINPKFLGRADSSVFQLSSPLKAGGQRHSK